MKFRKIIACLSFLVLAGTSGFSQVEVAALPEIGLNFGRIKNTLFDAPWLLRSSDNPKIGVRAGSGFQFEVNNAVGLQFGFYYEMYSYNKVQYAENNGEEYSVFFPETFHLATLPLSLYYHLNFNNSSSLYFGLGSYVNYIIFGKSGGADGKYPYTYNFKTDFIRLNYGLLGNIRYELPSGLYGKLELNYGLRDLSIYDFTTCYAQSLSLSVGYRIPLANRKQGNNW